jgi:hypothetical protein
MSGPVGNNPYRASGVVAAAAGGGAVDWCTTAQTSPLTAEAGKGYFINTSCGAITVTLPSSPTAGDIVAVKDYGGTWQTNNVTLGRGGEPINGECDDATLDTEAQSVTLIYVDATKGWQDVNDSTADVTGAGYITATGGDAIVTCGDWKTHIFTGSGTFCVSSLGGPTANTVEYLVVAGGGAGGYDTPSAGGGGAGGFRYFSALSPAGSPLVAPAGVTVTASPYSITVGAGGAAGPAAPQPSPGYSYNGDDSIFSTITSAGGGSGGAYGGLVGLAGGSGGGGGNNGTPIAGGAGDTPNVSPDQGFPGGTGGRLAPGPATNHRQGGGGGGASAAGTDVTPSSHGGAAGAGSYIVDGFIGPTAPSYGTPGPVSSTRYFAGGGGGAGYNATPGPTGGGAGGTGGGTAGSSGAANKPDCVAANTGGGAGGTFAGCSGTNVTAGGSGIVMIRYQYQ